MESTYAFFQVWVLLWVPHSFRKSPTSCVRITMAILIVSSRKVCRPLSAWIFYCVFSAMLHCRRWLSREIKSVRPRPSLVNSPEKKRHKKFKVGLLYCILRDGKIVGKRNFKSCISCFASVDNVLISHFFLKPTLNLKFSEVISFLPALYKYNLLIRQLIFR